MIEIDPWRRLQIDRERLAASLHQEEHGARRWAVILDGASVGVIGVRYPWLFGPYLMLLAIFPGHQSAGVGSDLLRWLDDEAQAARGAAGGNVWACVSSFNVRALSFYERHGFESIGELPDLVRSGYSEILIRKQLSRREAPDEPT